MATITVVAKLVAKKGCAESVKSELQKLIAPTRQEEGCIEYLLFQDNEDPDIFMFYETWESLACIEKHVETDQYKNYAASVADMLKEKIVHKMTRTD
jgi:quinol monooxygenase YgiN